MAAVRSSGSVLRTAHWPADDSADLVDWTVGGLLAERAHSHADRVAIVGVRHDGDQARLTYADLYDEAWRVATALSSLTEPGSYVALWAPNVVEWPIIQYGAALAGMVLVALNPALREEELEYALTHSHAAVLLHADTRRDHGLAEVFAAVRRRLPHLRCICLSERTQWQAARVDGAVPEAAPTDPDQPVMLQYTSGTTGRPKGVLLKQSRSCSTCPQSSVRSSNANAPRPARHPGYG